MNNELRRIGHETNSLGIIDVLPLYFCFGETAGCHEYVSVASVQAGSRTGHLSKSSLDSYS